MYTELLEKEQNEKLKKLKKMRFIATSLLVLMALVYFIFKRFEEQSFLISSVAAFSEAAMIGALADWFAVVALFRHPMGMSWIPHSAIIQKNQHKIGESLSNFVVSNFFTADVIQKKLKGIVFSESIISYLRGNKNKLADNAVKYIPDVTELVFNSPQIKVLIYDDLKLKLKNFNVYPHIDKILTSIVTSEMHVPVIKHILVSIHKWVSDNKENTLKVIEGLNKNFALPIVGDMVYRFIVKTLSKLIEDLDSEARSDFKTEMLHNLPIRALKDFSSSEEFGLKVEKLKNDILDSSAYDEFIKRKLADIKDIILNYSVCSREELATKLSNIFDDLIKDLFEDASVRQNIDSWIMDGAVSIISTYRQEIGKMISDTVKDWPMEDMVDKLETQVGGDLQYIRINGTIIGGLAGLAIHIISLWF